MNSALRHTQQQAAQRQYDNMSPDDALDPQAALYQHLLKEDPTHWLADAVAEAAHNDDLGYLKRQIARHVPGWVAA